MGIIRKCARHKGDDCEYCGGTGYRRVCTKSECVEYGCSGDGGCYATEAQYKKQVETKVKNNVAVASIDDQIKGLLIQRAKYI